MCKSNIAELNKRNRGKVRKIEDKARKIEDKVRKIRNKARKTCIKCLKYKIKKTELEYKLHYFYAYCYDLK